MSFLCSFFFPNQEILDFKVPYMKQALEALQRRHSYYCEPPEEIQGWKNPEDGQQSTVVHVPSILTGSVKSSTTQHLLADNIKKPFTRHHNVVLKHWKRCRSKAPRTAVQSIPQRSGLRQAVPCIGTWPFWSFRMCSFFLLAVRTCSSILQRPALWITDACPFTPTPLPTSPTLLRLNLSH